MKEIVIFSENDGWHEQRLADAFMHNGAQVQVVSLKDCHNPVKNALIGSQ